MQELKTQKKQTSQSEKLQMSRRDVLKLLGGTSTALLAGGFISQLFHGSKVTAQSAVNSYSHSNDTAPDYSVVFPSNLVNSIVITISPENWQAIQDDLSNLLGAFGTGQNQGGRQPGNAGQPANAGQRGNAGQPANAGQRGGGGQINFTEEDPIWIPVTVSFGDEVWEHVGFRYKGNSTLNGAWNSGSLKIGFKLNFDKFEDDYPEIDNQRFFGFDEMSFSSNYSDSSYLHEKVAADVFREAGIPAAHTAFYAISMDYGEGQQYIGLYTGIEEVDDTVLDTQFGNNDGNLYKPEGTGASFIAGTFDEASFEKKTNEDEADFSDILALFDALHADTRLSNPEVWRENLEAVLDVGEFMQWLAVNTVIQNWDTYGAMAHNFYLYNNEATGLLTWIPWDNNEALSNGGRNNNNGSLDLTGTSNDWPLISFLINDPVYQALYITYVQETVNTVFNPEHMTPIYETFHALIAPYVTGTATGSPDLAFESSAIFENSLTELINHVNQRYTLAQAYVSSSL